MRGFFYNGSSSLERLFAGQFAINIQFHNIIAEFLYTVQNFLFIAYQKNIHFVRVKIFLRCCSHLFFGHALQNFGLLLNVIGRQVVI